MVGNTIVNELSGVFKLALTCSTAKLFARKFKFRVLSYLLKVQEYLISSFLCHRLQVDAFAPLSTIKHGTRTSALQMAEGSSVPGPPYAGPASKPILDSVKYPSDMKRLNMRELKQVGTSRITSN